MLQGIPSLISARFGTITAPAPNDLLNSIYAYWKLDESSGTVVDSTGNGTDMSPNNSPTYGVTGVISTALLFASASSQNVSYIPSNPNFDSVNYSVSGWVKRTSISTLQTIFSHFDITFTSGWALRLDATNHVSLRHYGVAIAISNGTITDTTSFHHVAITYDGANVSFYIDGSFDSSVALAALTPCTAAAEIIGATNGTSNHFNGVIDELGYWTRVLTSGEVTALYNSGSGLSYPF